VTGDVGRWRRWAVVVVDQHGSALVASSWWRRRSALRVLRSANTDRLVHGKQVPTLRVEPTDWAPTSRLCSRVLAELGERGPLSVGEISRTTALSPARVLDVLLTLARRAAVVHWTAVGGGSGVWRATTADERAAMTGRR
jgi:hypothetical protein